MEHNDGLTTDAALEQSVRLTGHESAASSCPPMPAASSARRSTATKRVAGGDDGQLSLDFEGGPPVAPMLLTERQVCEMLNIGRTTLRSILELRPIHIGRCVRYLLSDVLEYIAGLS